MKTVARPAPVTSTHEKDDRDHFTCCFDDNTAICGADVTDAAWLDDDEPIDCADCDRLLHADDAWCEVNGDSESPCPHCPLNILGGAL